MQLIYITLSTLILLGFYIAVRRTHLPNHTPDALQ